MDKCNKCKKEMKLSFGIVNTNIAFPVLSDKPLYMNDDRIIRICMNKECDNYRLLQIIDIKKK